MDISLAAAIYAPIQIAWDIWVLHEEQVHIEVNFHHPESLIALVLYFALWVYFTDGRTPGKWLARTRVVSLTHDTMGPWQSTERALGYGASALELGFGFLQYFIARNRQTVHDRIAETIVIDTRKRNQSRSATS